MLERINRKRPSKNLVFLRGLLFSWVAIISVLFISCDSQKKTISLAYNGQAKVIILISKDSSTAQEFAGSELKKYLDKISGASFSISKDNGLQSPVIRLQLSDGRNKEHYSISIQGHDILLSGNSDRAVLYAVYDLLSRLGCLWLAPDYDLYNNRAEIIPDNKNLVYSAADIIEEPVFAFREIDVAAGRTHNEENLKQLVDWMPKVRLNTLNISMNQNGNGRVRWDKWSAKLTPELKKRGLLIAVGGHGYQNFLNADMEDGKIFKQHPEWFGKDSSCKWSPSERLVFNTADTGAVKYFINNIISYIKQHPEIDIFDLWPPDVGRWSDCPEFLSFGTPQDRQVQLANQVDSALREFRPDLVLEIIAYSYALAPPETVVLNRNILVDFCPINQSFEKPIYDTSSRNNAEYVSSLLSWRKKFPGDIGLYSYYRKYAWRSAPVVIPHYIQSDMKWYSKIPVQGISSYAEPGDWFTYELNHYILAQMGWNPDADVDSLCILFYQARYGGAAEIAKEAYASLEKIVPLYGSIPFTTLKSGEEIAQAREEIQTRISSLKHAKEKAGDAIVAANLSRLLLMFQYVSMDLDIQHARATDLPRDVILEKIRDIVSFLETNLDKGVFVMTGQNDFSRFTKKYGLTNQSLLD